MEDYKQKIISRKTGFGIEHYQTQGKPITDKDYNDIRETNEEILFMNRDLPKLTTTIIPN